ncbi:protein kinase [Endozoicomonas sp. Mp262]|uniref:protein kinase domain-containing protein n=1 Tax=Endozoicomonas sp. Mp262 TaxID=2919499 RepID=UPI0021D99E6A
MVKLFESNLYTTYYPQTLAEKLKDPASLTWIQRQTILIKVAEAIEALHSYGFIHRDIKADNIMLDRTDNPLLTDLASLANIVSELENSKHAHNGELNVCEDIRGTITNAAPEVIPDATGRQPYGAAADIWSFAVVCWFTFGGQETLFQAKWVPIEIRNRKENICYYYHEGLDEVFPKHFSPWQQYCKLSEIGENVPPYILRTCAASLNRDPKKRPTIGAIIQQLKNPHQEVIAIPKS